MSSTSKSTPRWLVGALDRDEHGDIITEGGMAVWVAEPAEVIGLALNPHDTWPLLVTEDRTTLLFGPDEDLVAVDPGTAALLFVVTGQEW